MSQSLRQPLAAIQIASRNLCVWSRKANEHLGARTEQCRAEFTVELLGGLGRHNGAASCFSAFGQTGLKALPRRLEILRFIENGKIQILSRVGKDGVCIFNEHEIKQGRCLRAEE